MDRLVASRFSLALGPIELPSPEAIRAAVVRLAAHATGSRLGFIEADPRHWIPLGGGIQERVSEVVRVPPNPQVNLRSWLEETWVPDLPIQFAVTDTRFALLCDHRLMDAKLATAIPPALCDMAQGGDVPDGLDRTTPHVLGSALTNTFLKHPATALKLLRSVHASPSSDSVPVDSPVGLPVSSAATDDVQHLTGVLESAQVRALRTWARGRMSFSAALLLLAARALRTVGVTLATKGVLVVDLRRYLGGSSATSGNFIGGLRLPVEGPSATPEGIEARLRDALDLGLPLATTTFTVLKYTANGVLKPPRNTAGAQPGTSSAPTTVSVSNSGVLRAVEKMPWLASPTERVVECLGDAIDPHAVGLLTCMVDRRLRIGVTFYPGHHPVEIVQRALDAMTSDPVALLAQGRSGTN